MNSQEATQMKMRRLVLALVMGLLILGVGSAPAAHANPPQTRELQLTQITPDSTLSNLCGFEVLRYTNVYATVSTYFDKNGDARRVLTRLIGNLEFRANGQTVEGSARTVENVRFSENGSNVVLDVVVNWTVAPGHGPVLHVTGSLRAEYDDQGNVLLFMTSGPEVSDLSICTALAPETRPHSRRI
jgi:hypothetical protein